MPNRIFALGIDTLAKVSFGGQSPNPVFVRGNSEVSVQISGRGKYAYWGMSSKQFLSLLRIPASLMVNMSDHCRLRHPLQMIRLPAEEGCSLLNRVIEIVIVEPQ
jgi:hypothetical protein